MKRISLLVMSLFILTACGQLSGDVLTFATADPGLTLHFRLLPPPPGVVVEPAVAPDPVAVAIEEEEAGQVDCNIAGNVASDGSLIFHLPEGAYYSRVKIDLTHSNADGVFEQWFCDEQTALDAGFRRSSR